MHMKLFFKKVDYSIGAMPASERSNMWKTTVYSVLLILVIWPLCHGRQVYHVTPNEETNCHNATTSCHTLDYYAKQLHSDPFYFQQQTVLYFHPGIHTLEGNISIVFKAMQEVVLLGSDETSSSGSVPFKSTEILCASEAAAGFIFLQVNNLVIANLTFTSCGLMYRNTSAAIRIGFVTNLTISHTVVQISTGYGVAATIDEPGNIVVTNSAFIYNGWDADQAGGHMILLRSSLVNCSAAGGSAGGIKLSIRSSMFLYGNTLGINPPGLVVNLEYPCYPFIIHINNSIFIGNREYQKGGGVGGHLFLIVLYSHLSKVHGSTVTIANSQFINGTAQFAGGAAAIGIEEEIGAYPCNQSTYPSQIHFALFNTLFYGNKALVGGGLQILSKEACHGHHTFEFNNVTFSNNSANYEAHMIIQKQVTAMHPHGIKIRNSTFANGEATLGCSLAIHVGRVDLEGTETCINNAYSTSTFTCVEISNSKFTNNKGVLGGGVFINMERYTTRSPCRIDICNSSFTSNAASALSVNLGNSISSAELYVVRFTDLHFHHNYFPLAQSPHHTNASTQDPDSAFQLYNDYFQTLASVLDTERSSSWSSLGAITLSNVKSATFFNCKVNDNKCTGLIAMYSNLVFEGRSTFRGNFAQSIGGGMLLKQSYILINSKLQLHFINNHATFGAAIYVSSNGHNCFFRRNSHPGTPVQDIGGMIQFENNSATIAGDVLYGGNVDKCSISEDSDPNTVEGMRAYTAHFNANYYGSELFNLTFNYSSQRGLSVISSDPVSICLCKDGEPRCDLRSMPIEAYPGEPFTVSAVGVGQRNGVTPTIVRAYHQKRFSSILLEETHPQKLSLQCSLLKYFVSSQHSFEKIILNPDTQNRLPIIEYPTLEVSLLPCPLGFNLSTATERCECAPPLDELNFNCSIASQTIHRPSAVWIGYYYFNSDDESSNNTVTPGGVIVHMHCPLDYCKTEDTELNLEDPNEQCAFNHSGILCGACQPGLSLALGTSRCLPCSNAYVALVFAFAVAGVALVALLTICNLTVSQGTLSGLIFYANIIHINHPIFFPGDDVNVLTVFIAWLNLDLGIETCFHQGMSMYEKAWLQFIFPAYVLLVSSIIMILSHYSTIATRIFGRHAVKVLATLFLLAYAKLLRSIITVLSYTSMVYPDHSLRFLWLYDGNIMYFHDKHIPLGLAAVMAFLLVIIPYTLTLIFGQCLQRGGCYRMVNGLKPFLDAYTGPYKDKYRFWPGILLLARVILFLIFAFNVQGAPALNLLSIDVISSLLFGTVLYCEVYKSSLHSLLESFFMLNIICLSIAMPYIQAVGGSQTAVSYTSAGATFAAFTAIVIYHSLKSISTSRLWRTVSGHVHRARQLPNNSQELAHLPHPQASPDHSDSSSDEEPLDVGHDRVQRLRLTFDSNDDAVLVVDKD